MTRPQKSFAAFVAPLAIAALMFFSVDAQAAAPCKHHEACGAQMRHHGQHHGKHRHAHHARHAHHSMHAQPIVHHHYHAPQQVNVIYGVAPVVPRYFVNQGPTLTGPARQVTGIVYDDAGIDPSYRYVRYHRMPEYDGGPYASPTTHYPVARPAGPGVNNSGVVRADAEIRNVGRDQINIRLYRRD